MRDIGNGRYEMIVRDKSGEEFPALLPAEFAKEVAKSGEWRLYRRKGQIERVGLAKPNGDRARISLHTLIARLAGITGRGVILADGDPLNCTRENLTKKVPSFLQTTSKTVVYDGVTYPSMHQAAKALGVPRKVIQRAQDVGQLYGKPIEIQGNDVVSEAALDHRRMESARRDLAKGLDGLNLIEVKGKSRAENLDRETIRRRLLRLHGWQERAFKRGGQEVDRITFALRVYRAAFEVAR